MSEFPLLWRGAEAGWYFTSHRTFNVARRTSFFHLLICKFYFIFAPLIHHTMTQRNTSWNAPYTFSGKEKDVETGYGYFGARYYDSGISIWISVDPMSDNTPFTTPYAYCINNPIMIYDPDGNDWYVNN